MTSTTFGGIHATTDTEATHTHLHDREKVLDVSLVVHQKILLEGLSLR